MASDFLGTLSGMTVNDHRSLTQAEIDEYRQAAQNTRLAKTNKQYWIRRSAFADRLKWELFDTIMLEIACTNDEDIPIVVNQSIQSDTYTDCVSLGFVECLRMSNTFNDLYTPQFIADLKLLSIYGGDQREKARSFAFHKLLGYGTATAQLSTILSIDSAMYKECDSPFCMRRRNDITRQLRSALSYWKSCNFSAVFTLGDQHGLHPSGK